MNDNYSPLLFSPLLTSKHNIIFSNKIIKKKMKKKKKGPHTRWKTKREIHDFYSYMYPYKIGRKKKYLDHTCVS